MTTSLWRSRHLVVMVKEPRPGRVKTRLASDIGTIDAAWWFRRQSGRLLREVIDPRWRTWLAVSPDIEGLRSRVWPSHLQRLPQGQGDLGERMGRVFRSLPPGPALIVGADIPALRCRHLVEGFSALGDHDGVVGPAADGGYWMVGLKRTAAVPPNLFQGVRWSTRYALGDTLRFMPARTASISVLSDVDTAADLRRPGQ